MKFKILMLSSVAAILLTAGSGCQSRGAASRESKLESKQMTNGTTPLMFAAEKGDLSAVEKLLAQGAAVNATRSDGYTALHCAAQSGNLGVVQVLLKAGANVNARAKQNVSPLMVSIDMAWGKPQITLALIRAGADVNAAESRGDTPLWTAVTESSDEVIEELLKRGANPNTKVQGTTPLEQAALNGMVGPVRLLLKYGADPSIRDSEGKTPLDVANPRWPEIARLLKESTQNGSDIS
jgi:ankyrin repeat protein